MGLPWGWGIGGGLTLGMGGDRGWAYPGDGGIGGGLTLGMGG